MGSDVKEKLTQIGTRILVNARNELYLAMRFLDIALNSLGYEFNLSTFFVGTDGINIYYNPRFLMQRYEHQPLLVNRAYLHMVMHCIFKHMYDAENREEDEWNLACDIATEYILDSFDYKAVTRVVSDYREEVYQRLQKELKVLTAEGIYKKLLEDAMSYQEYVKLTTEFLVDDHVFWSKKRKESKSITNSENNENQQKTEHEKLADKENNSKSEDKPSEQETENNMTHNDRSSKVTGDNRNSSNTENKSERKGNKISEADKNSKPDDALGTNKSNFINLPKHTSGLTLKEDFIKDKLEEERQQEQRKTWGSISEKMKTNLETLSENQGNLSIRLQKALQIETRERYDYKNFLRKFAVHKEVMQVDTDSFDYGFYNFGLQTYGNMPLMEYLEYKEVDKIEEFVIALDTSGSCSGEVVQNFLRQTYAILHSTESFMKKVQIHIIQCDMEIREHVIIRSLEEFDNYMKEFKFHGFGGTDFRPVFTFINQLIETQSISHLKGMIYFTDGYGFYPAIRPNYDVAFIFLKDDFSDANVPAWAMKLIISTDDINQGNENYSS